MTNQGLMTDREEIIRRIAVEWYRWKMHFAPYSRDWDLKDVRQALILHISDFIVYAKYHGNFDFTRQEVLAFYVAWNVGGCDY